MHDDADRQAEELVETAHPFGVAAGEVVVDGNDVHALAGQGVEVDGQSGDKRLAFTGAHFGDAAAVKHHAADHLDVEGTHAERALGAFAHRGEGRDQKVVERGAVGDVLAELLGPRPKLVVGQRLQFIFHCSDRFHPGPGRLDAAVVGGTENLTGETAETDHQVVLSIRMKPTVRRPNLPGNIGWQTQHEKRPEKPFWTRRRWTDKRGHNLCQRCREPAGDAKFRHIRVDLDARSLPTGESRCLFRSVAPRLPVSGSLPGS